MSAMSPKLLSWISSYVVLAILIMLGILLFWPERGILLPALTPKPERFTELFFNDHLQLPKRIVEEQVNEFSFTIHNLEGKNINYSVEVIAINEASPSSLAIFSDSVVVSDLESKSVPIRYAISAGLGEKIKVQVTLKNLNQSIHFWVNPISTQLAAAKGLILISSASAKPSSSPLTSPRPILSQ